MINVIPHTGRKANGEEVVLDQFQVMLNGKRIAYCGRKENTPINFIRPVDEATRQQVVEEVKKTIKGEPSKVVHSKELSREAKEYAKRVNSK